MVAFAVQGHAIELGLQFLDLISHRTLLLRDGLFDLSLFARVPGALRELLHVGLHVLLLIGELLRRTNRVAQIAR